MNAVAAIKIAKGAIPHLVLPPVPTPATASSWGWQLHRRVQLHRHHFYGNVFERRAKLEVSFAVKPQEVDGAGRPQRSGGTWAVGAVFFAYFLARQKVGRQAGRDPPSVSKSSMLPSQKLKPNRLHLKQIQAPPAIKTKRPAPKGTGRLQLKPISNHQFSICAN